MEADRIWTAEADCVGSQEQCGIGSLSTQDGKLCEEKARRVETYVRKPSHPLHHEC